MPLPSLDRYLASLPAGFDSYPDALVKATVVLPWREGAVGAALRACSDLPARLRTTLEQPLAVSDWVSEVALDGVMEAAFDVYFARTGGADALQAFIRATNREVFKGPLYRILFAVVSPSRLLSGTAQRWAAFHRGSSLATVERGTVSAVLELIHPPQLFSTNARIGHGTSFALAVELAGGREIKMSVERSTPTTTRYVLAWR